ncbi:MAG: methyl-accepting chemotaxis protein [Pseudomonadota bacterium]
MFANLSAGKKILVAFTAFASVAGAGTAVVLLFVLIIAHNGLVLGERLVPVNNASIEMQSLAGEAAQLRKRVGVTDLDGTQAGIAGHIDEALAIAQTLQGGGVYADRPIAPAVRPQIVASLGAVKDSLLAMRGAALPSPEGGSSFEAAFAGFEKSAVALDAAIASELQGSVLSLRGALRSIIIAMVVACVLLGVAVLFSYRWLDAMLSRRLRELAGTIAKLTSGDLSAQPPAWTSKDEVGILRDSVEDLREAFLQQKRLEAEAHAEREKAEQERQVAQEHHKQAEAEKAAATEQRAISERQRGEAEARAAATDHLVEEFGAVVGRASEGAFDRQIRLQFDETSLNELARGMNALLTEIDRGIGATKGAVARLADGNLDETMTGDFHGAFADLKRDVNETMSVLGKIVHSIASTSDAIVSDLSGISENAVTLASRAADQARSLKETASTMVELETIVRANTEGAERVAERIQHAADTASTGGGIVDEAVEAMSHIDHSAQQVKKIVSVLDEISFQTNLLALNASVEAARAGDAGKGFAVVASEVRALAQRSTEAASEIDGLIETSLKDVAEGVRLVTETGSFLQQIVGEIGKAASTTGEITQSSQSQATGISSVSARIGEMDALTQQFAGMAEQSADSARGLLELARKLNELLDFFRRTDSDRKSRENRAA